MKFRFSGDDIAAAFGMAAPSTRCASCPHSRYEHRRVVTPNPDDRFHPDEEHFECERWDRRRKSGVCPCAAFAEAVPDSES